MTAEKNLEYNVELVSTCIILPQGRALLFYTKHDKSTLGSRITAPDVITSSSSYNLMRHFSHYSPQRATAKHSKIPLNYACRKISHYDITTQISASLL